MKVIKTEHGIRLTGFGGFDGLRAFLDAINDMKEDENANIDPEDDVTSEVNENLNDEDCDDGPDTLSIDAEEDDGEDMTSPELNSFDHVLSIAYDDDSDIVSISRDFGSNTFSMCAALCYALSLLWPDDSDKFCEFKSLMHDLGDDLHSMNDDVEVD